MNWTAIFTTLGVLAAGVLPSAVGATASETPQVLFDAGTSVPLAPSIAQLVGGEDEAVVLDGLVFPFRTALKPLVLQRDGVPVLDATWLTQPIAVVAADDLSVRWLAFNHAKLAQVGAVVLVVQAKDVQAFRLLQQFAQPMGIAPETGPWLAGRLQAAGAGVYPLLVHTNGRAYQVLPKELRP